MCNCEKKIWYALELQAQASVSFLAHKTQNKTGLYLCSTMPRPLKGTQSLFDIHRGLISSHIPARLKLIIVPAATIWILSIVYNNPGDNFV